MGQGNYDALFAMVGLVIGSYLFAEASKKVKATVDTWGDKGKLMLPEALHISRGIFVPLFALILIGVLFGLSRVTGR